MVEREKRWAPQASESSVRQKVEFPQAGLIEKGPGIEVQVRRILIIDDEKAVTGIACKLIERLGHAAAFAQNAATGLRLVREAIESGKPFDTVIVDFRLPDLSGDMLAKAIREVSPNARILLSTGFSSYGEDSRAMGFDGFLAKPFTLAEFRQALQGSWL